MDLFIECHIESALKNLGEECERNIRKTVRRIPEWLQKWKKFPGQLVYIKTTIEKYTSSPLFHRHSEYPKEVKKRGIKTSYENINTSRIYGKSNSWKEQTEPSRKTQ